MKQQLLYSKSIKPKRKPKKHFANYVVYISLTAVVAYTITAFILQSSGLGEVSPTLTTCFYSFFGVELASLALIKHSKNKYTGGGNYGNTGTTAGMVRVNFARIKAIISEVAAGNAV